MLLKLTPICIIMESVYKGVEDDREKIT